MPASIKNNVKWGKKEFIESRQINYIKGQFTYEMKHLTLMCIE